MKAPSPPKTREARLRRRVALVHLVVEIEGVGVEDADIERAGRAGRHAQVDRLVVVVVALADRGAGAVVDEQRLLRLRLGRLLAAGRSGNEGDRHRPAEEQAREFPVPACRCPVSRLFLELEYLPVARIVLELDPGKPRRPQGRPRESPPCRGSASPPCCSGDSPRSCSRPRRPRRAPPWRGPRRRPPPPRSRAPPARRTSTARCRR